MEQMRASERRGRPPSPPQPVGRNGVVSFVNAAQVHHLSELAAQVSKSLSATVSKLPRLELDNAVAADD